MEVCISEQSYKGREVKDIWLKIYKVGFTFWASKHRLMKKH